MERKALVEVEVPAPDEPVTAIMGCLADMGFSLPWEFRYKVRIAVGSRLLDEAVFHHDIHRFVQHAIDDDSFALL